MPFPLAKNKGERKVERVNRPASAVNGGVKPDERVVYCGEFQNGSCTLQDNHRGKFFGQHICATCWKELKTCAHHPASSTECPLYEHWLLESGPGWEGPVMTNHDGVWCCIENGEMRDVGGLIDLHEKVKSTGLPNFQLAKIPIRSKWNIEYMQSQLAGYQDKKVVTFCKYGWPIGITDGKNLEQESLRNHSGAREFPDQMSKYITRELGEGTLLGPFKTNPFRSPMVVSPLNTTEKRDSDERRVIMDLSFPPGRSVNDRIPKDSYLGEATGLRYPSVDALTQLVREKGAGCALMKCDLKRAYKQIQVDPRDWNFLGMKWQGKLYFDMTMPMGLRSAAMCCQRLTNAITYIMRSHGFDLVAYLDDMVTAECWEQAGACFSTLREVIATMGAVEAESKAVSPCTRMNFLGICFNTELLTMEVPQERISECMSLLVEWLKKEEVTRKEVESLVGKLSFIATCVRPGRIFISGLLEYLRGLPRVGKVKVPVSVRKDLVWWKTFLPHYNRVSMMPMERWSLPDEVVATDACLSGCGAWFETQREYFHAEFPEGIKRQELSINALELLTVVVAAKVWGKKWRGLRIVIRCDNETSVTVLNTGRAYNSFLLECLRELEFVAAKCEFEMKAIHIPGVENRIPDALSRWELGEEHRLRFREMSEGMGPKEVYVYPGLFEFTHDW